ncbi:hypothetical protein [Vibrio cholerae]|uniref:hypothetical protein n=1 Tax=Vibrio cholerae TaxID=666 RepID=UPI00293503BE|nr:hypothetical protein [Vibrio cholerae]MDV2330195.1 hypothetical protein [Vibrio cholerae]
MNKNSNNSNNSNNTNNSLIRLNLMTYPMKSIDLLEIINEARVKNDKTPMRHDNFMEKCRDELDGTCPEISVDVKVANGATRKTPVLLLSREDCLCMAMRESKQIRKLVVEYIKYLEQNLVDCRIEALTKHIVGTVYIKKDDRNLVEAIIKQSIELGTLKEWTQSQIETEIKTRLFNSNIQFKQAYQEETKRKLSAKYDEACQLRKDTEQYLKVY